MPQPKVISFHYTLTNSSGQVLDSSQGKSAFSFIEGARQIIPGLESALTGLRKGDKKKIEVAAKEAYGEKNDSMIVKAPREKLPTSQVKVGDRFRGGPEPSSPIFTVTEINDQEVTLDGNHPLAGQDLIFDVEMVESREATPEELEHGHAHGEGGHTH